MSELRVGYDVVIAGAGPAGIAAAAAFAARGAEVLLLEAEPSAATRLAGEWMHPTGADVLARLGLLPEEALLDRPVGRGFVIFPEDGSPRIELAYAPVDRGFACEHEVLVGALRERIRTRARVRYVEGARLTDLDVANGRVRLRVGTDARELEAGLVVGADGKGSTVRKRLYDGESAPAISQMAGLLLADVELPCEGMGHVFVGGPGPALAYRLDARHVRLCLDVPSAHGRRGPRDLYAAFAPALPASLRGAFRDALEARPVVWAGTRLRARLDYGRGKVGLVGDAVGVVHPLCAAGMTLGLLDAERLASAPSVTEYAKTREAESHVPELLSQALYEVLVRVDPSASAIRAAMYRTFREDAAERLRTMNILAGREIGRDAFSSAFVKVALTAARGVADGARAGSPLRAARSVRKLAEWSRYPVRALAPRGLRAPQRSLGARTAFPLRPLSPASEEPVLVEASILASRRVSPPTLPLSTIDRCAGALARAAALGTVAALGPIARELFDALGRKKDAATLAELAAAAEAIAEALEVHPGLANVACEAALRSIRERVLAREDDAGGFGSVEHTACAIRALRAAGERSVSAVVRRAVDFLLDRQLEDGSFAADDADPARATALVLGALRRAECSDTAAVHRAVRRLAREFPFRGEVAEPARAALSLYHRRISDGPAEPPRRLRKNPDGSLVGPDWEYCVEALEQVSRSFAKPIAALPEPLRVAVTCGYLLCRIADTVEDAPDTLPEQRDVHYARLLEVLDGRRLPSHFARGIEGLPGKPEELELCARIGRVLHVLDTVPAPMAGAVKRWASEMVRGMAIYSHRPLGHDALRAPAGIADLERYCYYVAGTVGHMLTELFLLHMGELDAKSVRALREEAESFGIGLQLVNILKDITDDQARGVSYVPRSLADGRGLALPDLLDESKRTAAHTCVEPLFDVARRHLDRALEYTLAIPRSEPRVRLFCLLPLWMAARTLVHARGNDAMFVPDRPVKIERAEVEALAADCIARAGNDDALRAGYAALWTETKKTRRAQQPVL